MNEKEKWEVGVIAVQKEYSGLSPEIKSHVRRCVAKIRSWKNKIHMIADGAGAADLCAICFGECCKGGKGHVRVVDLIAYLSDGREIFTPCFEREICPYLGENGCLMEPGYRPYNCITFICERVEDLLDASEKERYYAMERELRTLYRELEELFDKRFRYSLLSVCERQIQGEKREPPDEFPGFKENC